VSFFDSAKEKLQELAGDHPDQVEQLSDQAIERGGDLADGATGGTYAEHVDQAQVKADGAVGHP
jgi:hypothetical protein